MPPPKLGNLEWDHDQCPRRWDAVQTEVPTAFAPWASEYGACVTETTHHEIQDIGPDEAVALVDAGAFLLDVRENEEWAAGHAPQATHLPMGEIQDRASELPVDRTVVCMCRVGGRSGAVATSLAGAGYDVRNVDGGMLAWAAVGLPVVDDAGAPGAVV